MEEVYYHSKSKGEDIPVSEMSDLYVRRAFKKMILKEKKRFDEKETLKVFIRNAINNLERALEEKWQVDRKFGRTINWLTLNI